MYLMSIASFFLAVSVAKYETGLLEMRSKKPSLNSWPNPGLFFVRPFSKMQDACVKSFNIIVE